MSLWIAARARLSIAGERSRVKTERQGRKGLTRDLLSLTAPEATKPLSKLRQLVALGNQPADCLPRARTLLPHLRRLKAMSDLDLTRLLQGHTILSCIAALSDAPAWNPAISIVGLMVVQRMDEGASAAETVRQVRSPAEGVE